jgi:hypothetical protein
MDKLMHPIGMWCKRGAWVIATVGLIGVVVEVYLFVRASGGASWSSILVQLLPLVLSIVPTFIFYSLILYAAGVIIDRFLVYTAGNSTKAKVGGVMLDEVEETAIKPTMVDAQGIGDMTQDKVEDVISQSSTAEAAEEESDVTLTNEEASPIKPTTVESNGENSDMKPARRRQRK